MTASQRLMAYALVISLPLVFENLAFAAQPDLVIQSISHTPEPAMPGDAVVFTVTVKNQGTATTGLAFDLAFWANLSQAPLASDSADQTAPATMLVAGASANYVFTVTAPAAGTYSAWSFSDKSGVVLESDETNNAGPQTSGHAWTVVNPVVTVSATDPSASESGLDTATITVSRNGNRFQNLSVNYLVTGSASNGVDYVALSGNVVIPAGFASAPILITPINDATAEPTETVIITLTPTGSYTIGNQNSATAGITDDDNIAPIVLLGSATPNPAQVNDAISFSATALDANGDTITFDWSFDDGSVASGNPVSHAFSQAGNHLASLTVSDPNGGTGNYSVTVIVTSPPAAVAPTITSSPTASGTKGQLFTYTITATGTQPIVFNATNLPAGVTFANDTISGIPISSGASNITLTASNSAGTDTKTLVLSISDPTHANNPPVFSSLPSATPNPALPGASIQFKVAATDADGDLLVYAWDFGDGSVAVGDTVSHAFAATGLYDVNVSVSDGQASDSASVHVSVVSALPDDSGTSTGGSTASKPNIFKVRKASLRFNVRNPGMDMIALSGDLPIKIGTSIERQYAHFAIADVSRDVQLDVKGRSGDKINSFKLSGKMKSGFVLKTPMKFTLALKKQSLTAEFADYIFQDDKGAYTIQAPVLISIGNSDWQVDTVRFSYNPNTGSTKPIPSR